MSTYIPRVAEDRLQKGLKSSKIVLLLGPRQSGKTTLLKHVLKDKARFFNLDLSLDRQRLLTASALVPDEAINSLGKPQIMVIDEAQKLPEIERIVKGWYDYEVGVKFILSGSSSLDLLDQSAESLTGRNVKVFLPPLTFAEIVKNQSWYSKSLRQSMLSGFKNQIDSLLLLGLTYGSYPEAVTTGEKREYLSNLVSDYLLKDIFQSGLVKTPDLLQRLLALLSHQVGSIVSVNEVANNLNISRKTVERYLDLMERTFIIFRLPAFSTNPRKEIAKSQKIYFWDTGVRNALIGELNPNPLRPDIGSLWENWVVSEFAKINLLRGNTDRLYFWRGRGGGEVDLVVKKIEGIMKAYEIKWSRAKAPTKKFTTLYKIPIEIVTKDNFTRFLL